MSVDKKSAPVPVNGKSAETATTAMPPAAPAEVPVVTSTRRYMPDDSEGKIHKFCFKKGLKEEVKGYVLANFFDDGTLGTIDIIIDRAGSLLRTSLHVVADLTSKLLQQGVLIEEISKPFERTRCEPAGATDNELVPNATSIFDFVFRILLLKYSKAKVDPYARAVIESPPASPELPETA